MPNTREKLIKLLIAVSCNGNESPGSCPDRKYGLCGEVANLSYCVIQNTADHLIANGVTVQEWIPVTERLPRHREWVLVWHTGYQTPKKAFYKDDLAPCLPIMVFMGR